MVSGFLHCLLCVLTGGLQVTVELIKIRKYKTLSNLSSFFEFIRPFDSETLVRVRNLVLMSQSRTKRLSAAFSPTGIELIPFRVFRISDIDKITKIFFFHPSYVLT